MEFNNKTIAIKKLDNACNIKKSHPSEGSLTIINAIQNAKKRKMIVQDPSDSAAVTLTRSDNEDGGIEFMYSFWTYIDDWSYKYGQWKHVMHKGNEDSRPNRAPGVWLHPRQNKFLNRTKSFLKFFLF